MKKQVIVIFFVILFVACWGSWSSVNASDVPDKILHYAENEGMRALTGMLSASESSTSKNIDGLKLGKGYNLYYVTSEMLMEADKLSDAIRSSDDWLFTVDDRNGNPLFFLRIYNMNGEFGSYGGGDACAFGTAFDIMYALIRNSNCDGDPILVSYRSDLILLCSIEGSEKVILLSGASKLDPSYLRVTDWKSLPEGEDALHQMQNIYEEAQSLPAGSLGGGSISLKATVPLPEEHIGEDTQNSENAILWITILVGILLFFPTVVWIRWKRPKVLGGGGEKNCG